MTLERTRPGLPVRAGRLPARRHSAVSGPAVVTVTDGISAGPRRRHARLRAPARRGRQRWCRRIGVGWRRLIVVPIIIALIQLPQSVNTDEQGRRANEKYKEFEHLKSSRAEQLFIRSRLHLKGEATSRIRDACAFLTTFTRVGCDYSDAVARMQGLTTSPPRSPDSVIACRDTCKIRTYCGIVRAVGHPPMPAGGRRALPAG